MPNKRHRIGRLSRLVWILGLLVTVPSLVLGTGVRPAAAETTVTTIHVPAQVETNPCFPADVINLNGDIRIVVSTTTGPETSASSAGHRSSGTCGSMNTLP